MNDSTMQEILDNMVKAESLITEPRGASQFNAALGDLRTGRFKMAALKLNAISREANPSLDLCLKTTINLIKKEVSR